MVLLNGWVKLHRPALSPCCSLGEHWRFRCSNVVVWGLGAVIGVQSACHCSSTAVSYGSTAVSYGSTAVSYSSTAVSYSRVVHQNITRVSWCTSERARVCIHVCDCVCVCVGVCTSAHNQVNVRSRVRRSNKEHTDTNPTKVHCCVLFS